MASYSPQGAILCWSEERVTSLVGLRFLKRTQSAHVSQSDLS